MMDVHTQEDFEELKKRALLGDPAAQCAVADLCADDSRAAFFDLPEAVIWYERAAAQGHTKAQWLLGISYAQGMGVEKDLAKAESWLLKSAHSGDADGQYALGGFYFMMPDIVKAEYWLDKAVGQGHADAQAVIGAIKILLDPGV